MKHLRGGLLVLATLALTLAVALPESSDATTLNEVKKLIASDAQAGDQVGQSVAVDGDITVIGAAGEADHAGAVYVFQQNQGGAANWGEAKKLTSPDAEANDEFGFSVAVSGDTIVVGAWVDSVATSPIGTAYVFQRDQGGTDNWGVVKRLIASFAQSHDLFGASVAVSGDTVVVGAYAVGPFHTGAAYVFERNEGGADNWGEVKKLTASDAQVSDQFGISVAVSGNTTVVGARNEEAGGGQAGAAYVFERNEGGANNWGEARKLTASDAQAIDQFGYSVALSGDTAVVGAWLEDTNGSEAGAAYVFQSNEGGAGNWGEVRKLTASDARANDEFGISVAVSGSTAVVGAWSADGWTSDMGIAYVFHRDQGGADNWGQAKKLTASDAQASDFFGRGVAVHGGIAVVGAPREDAGGNIAGAAYVFQEPAPTIIAPTPINTSPTVTPALTPTNTPAGPTNTPVTPTNTLAPPTNTPAGPTATPPPNGLLGDVNCDGNVNAIDSALILQLGAGLVGSLPCEENADVNESGDINAIDAAIILQFSAGLLGSLPP